MLQHRRINSAEELLGVAVFGILLHISAMAGGRTRATTTVGALCVLAISVLLAQPLVGGLRHIADRRQLMQRIAVALKHFEGMAAQTQDLVAVGRLNDTHQGLGVKAVGNDGQLSHWSRQAINPKEIACAKNGQAIACVVPEVVVFDQCLKRLQQRPLCRAPGISRPARLPNV